MARPERHSNVSIKTDFITQADSAKTVISKATIKKRRRWLVSADSKESDRRSLGKRSMKDNHCSSGKKSTETLNIKYSKSNIMTRLSHIIIET